LQVFELDGASDYRMQTMSELDLYITPLGRDADAKMDAAWVRLTQGAKGTATSLHVLGREVPVPRAAAGVARFDFADLCTQPLAAADFLALAREFSTVMLDRIPLMEPARRNEAKRFILLIDTLYDEGVKFICSAAAAADRLYPAGDGAEAFRRTVSRLTEMQSREYLERNN
jgi:cell division protein ZapE